MPGAWLGGRRWSSRRQVHGVPAGSRRLPGGPRPEQRAGLVPAAQGGVRAAAEGADGGAVAALADRFEARGLPLQADPKRSVSRIYRDTRFAKDKSPYKTNVYAGFPWMGRGADHDASDDHAQGASGYFNLMPGESYVGRRDVEAGEAATGAFRAAIVDEPDRVEPRWRTRRFLAAFGPVHSHDPLKRVPPGFPPDHPMAELFRYKDVIFGRNLSDDEIRSPELPDVLADAYAAAAPVFRFLGHAWPRRELDGPDQPAGSDGTVCDGRYATGNVGLGGDGRRLRGAHVCRGEDDGLDLAQPQVDGVADPQPPDRVSGLDP